MAELESRGINAIMFGPGGVSGDSPVRGTFWKARLTMSLDRSLKVAGGALSQHRNVLTRPERIAKLADTTTYDPKKKPVLGLPKTANRKVGR